MDERRLPSLDLLLDEVRLERDAQLRHFDSLDSKAGIILGFAGAIVALSPQGAGVLVHLGRGLAVAAAALAIWAFWPRGYKVIGLRSLRDRYLTADERFTRLALLDTQIAMSEATMRVLRGKAWRVKGAMALLGFAAALTAVGLVV